MIADGKVCFERISDDADLAEYWRKARIRPTREERIVARLIFSRRMRNAVRTAEIAEQTGLPEREIRSVIERLRSLYRMPIGSSKRKPGGYFWIRNKTEAKVALRTYTSGATTTLKTARRFIPQNLL